MAVSIQPAKPPEPITDASDGAIPRSFFALPGVRYLPKATSNVVCTGRRPDKTVFESSNSTGKPLP